MRSPVLRDLVIVFRKHQPQKSPIVNFPIGEKARRHPRVAQHFDNACPVLFPSCMLCCDGQGNGGVCADRVAPKFST